MSDLPVLACAVLLAAGVSAAVSAAVVRYSAEGQPRIASVRLAELAAAQAASAARSGVSPEDTAASVRAWAIALEDALEKTAERHRAVLLPVRAVAAGAPDLTSEVEAALATALERAAGGAEARR